MANRTKIPRAVASQVLIANRHACCVCQKHRVQIHHIDGNPSNNDPANLAPLCHDHHDMASTEGGLTKRLRPEDVRHYKSLWEDKCSRDIEAFSRDRLSYYLTVYKNPPRIRELFSKLTSQQRVTAANALRKQLLEEEAGKAGDGGYEWQTLPRVDDRTLACLHCLVEGDFWPSFLPRVRGHEVDPDYPVDMSPPDGMAAFHGYDLYCQLLVRALSVIHPPLALEQLRGFESPDVINDYAGSLVTFREVSSTEDVPYHSEWKTRPAFSLQFRRAVEGRTYVMCMNLKTMYIFSDTSTLELRRSRMCGIGVLAGSTGGSAKASPEIEIFVKPLIIGCGGLGQSKGGWWDYNRTGESNDL